MKKRIMSFILCMVMACSVFSGMLGVSSAKAAELDENDYCADISGYREGEKEAWTYPTKEGYVFAGWYTKKDFQQRYALTDSMVSGGAYAKFVREDVFSVKYQMNSLANMADESMNLRMLTTVDDLTYQSVGFRFETGVVSQKFMSSTVYNSILADGKTIEPSTFSEDSNYIVGHSVNNIPYYHYAAEFTMTPILVTLDGTTVEGVSRSMNIHDDYRVAPDQTFTYTGDGTEIYFDTRLTIKAGQWIVFDIEGLTKGVSGQGVRWTIHGGGESFDGSKEGCKNTCLPGTDTIRVYGQFTDSYTNRELKVHLWADNSLVGQEITYSNIRILNEPEDAYYYEVNGQVSNYVGPNYETITSSYFAKAGRILSYKVAMEHGNVANASICLNNKTTSVEASQIYTNADGTQTVQFVLPEDAKNFKPAFEIQNLSGATSNKISIEEIKILNALDRQSQAWATHNASAIDWTFDLNGTFGQKYTFDIDCERMLNVYAYYYKDGNSVGGGLVSAGVTHRGIQTIPATIPAVCDQIVISLRDYADSSLYTARIANFDMEESNVLPDAIRISCVGDSITQGVGASNQGTMSYPAQLQGILGDEYYVYNAGLSGSEVRVNSSKPYTAQSQYQAGLAFNPNIVIIMLGTNDAYADRCTTPELLAEFKRDYKTIIDAYQALITNPKIFLVLPPYVYSDWDQRQSNLENYIMPVIRELAEEYNLDLIDMNTFTAGHSDWFPDTLHPSDVAHTQIAEEFSKYILQENLNSESNGGGDDVQLDDLLGNN